jgi:acyl dehydratase
MQSLLPSYAKAVVGPLIPGGGGGELPAEPAEAADIEIDRDHVFDYARVCGFGVRDTLPPTYPHMLGFPLQMSYMTRRGFPFPLLGLVHIANRIEQRRPIPLTATPTVRVWGENLRPHRRGRQLDMVTEASLDGDVVWLEQSTYLRRGEGDESASSPKRPAEEAELETSAIWKIPGDIGRRYADVSGDRNPIHLHALTARLFGFPSAIAHGMWTLARCLAAFEGRAPGAQVSDVEFKTPLRIPGRARLASGRSGEADAWLFRLESADGERTHVVGSIEAP